MTEQSGQDLPEALDPKVRELIEFTREMTPSENDDDLVEIRVLVEFDASEIDEPNRQLATELLRTILNMGAKITPEYIDGNHQTIRTIQAILDSLMTNVAAIANVLVKKRPENNAFEHLLMAFKVVLGNTIIGSIQFGQENPGVLLLDNSNANDSSIEEAVQAFLGSLPPLDDISPRPDKQNDEGT